MDIQLAGTGETTDLPIIIFSIALFFGIMFFLYWFPGWRKQKLLEEREAEFLQILEAEDPVSDPSNGEDASNDSQH